MDRLDPQVLHFNARVRGMKSDLFTAAAIRDLLDRDDIGHVVDVLLESPYRVEVAEALARYAGGEGQAVPARDAADAIEEALGRNLGATRRRLIGLVDGDFGDLVSVFFLRHDLRSVKSLLRCRHRNLDGEAAAPYLIPGPTLTALRMRELAGADSMAALVRELMAWNEGFTRCLFPALDDYETTSDLARLEETLDRDYFAENASRLGASRDPNRRALAALLHSEIDRINLRALFQFFATGRDRAALRDRLLPEGTLSVVFVERMAEADDAAGAMECLGNTPYRALIEQLYSVIQTHRFAPVERFFERIILAQLRRMARSEVFGLPVVMEYGWLKYNEMLNLRLVARGLAGHLPKGRVREELYLVR